MKILTELLPIGHAVLSARRNIAFPIEHDQITVVCQGDRIGAAGNQSVRREAAHLEREGALDHCGPERG